MINMHIIVTRPVFARPILPWTQIAQYRSYTTHAMLANTCHPGPLLVHVGQPSPKLAHVDHFEANIGVRLD